MVKNGHKLFCLSLCLFLFAACQVPSTYQRANIVKIIKDLCKQEFNLEVKVWDLGQTIWIYSPFEKILDEKQQFDPKVIEDTGRILMAINRVVLSMDRPPKFYVFVFSDIKELGADVYYAGYVPDILQYQLEQISRDQMREREAISYGLNPQALGDLNGDHFQKYDLNMGDYLALLVRQNIDEYYRFDTSYKDHSFDRIEAYYYNGALKVSFNLPYITDKNKPFELIKSAVKKYLLIYNFFTALTDLEIFDTNNNTSRLITRLALMENKL
jgi:hypothetical protein